MAELVTEPHVYGHGQRMRIRTRNALGRWDWVVDGDTGKPIEANLTDSWMQGLASPRETIEAIHQHMLTITERVSVLEGKPW